MAEPKVKIRLLTGMAGNDFSLTPGEIHEFDAATAKRLVDSEQGQLVDKPKRAPKREAAVREQRETADKPAASKRSRKS